MSIVSINLEPEEPALNGAQLNRLIDLWIEDRHASMPPKSATAYANNVKFFQEWWEAAVEEISFQIWTADDVLAAFNSQGVELGEVRPMTRDDFGPAPYVAVEAMRFLVPSLGEGRGGRLLIFDEQEDLDITRHYYVELGEAGTMFFSHVFSRDNVLIQINGDMPDEQAATYEAALLAME